MAALSDTVRHIRRIAEVQGLRDYTDREVLARFIAERSEAAFTELVRRHGAMVLAVCRRVLRQDCDAEDVFQAVFLVLARKAGSIRQRASIGGWLYQVAYRLALRARATAGRRQRQLDRLAEEARAARNTRASPDSAVGLYEEVQRLPEPFRSPVVLCYFEGRSQGEAARLLGTTTDAVK